MFGKLVICGLLGLTLAAPTRKCLPLQWEGIALGKVAQVSDSKPLVISITARSSNDFKNAQREAFHEVVEVSGTVMRLALITDYKANTSHYIEYDQKKCQKMAIPGPYEEFCSDTAKPISSLMMGGKMVDMYEIERIAFGNKVRSTLSLYRDSFTPVTEILEQEFSGIPQMVALQFGNITMGIEDEKVFEIPSFCNS